MNQIIWYNGYDLLIDHIEKAENCYLYDAAGKQYIDLESGVWCTSIGHNHPAITELIKKQCALISHTGFSYGNKSVENAARVILDLIGFKQGKCVFLCSGSEAVEYGVRTAQQLSGKPLLLSMSDSYFGAYGSASIKNPEEWYSFDWQQCTVCSISESCDPGCEKLKEIPFDKIGGFLFEPGSSSGFVRFPPKSLIEVIADKITENEGLILVNEVTTGIGRTGKWFGYQHYDLNPDIVALGKGIGNGYPVSVAAFNEKVASSLAQHPIRYSQSHQNDPLGAMIAMEVINVIKQENLIERGNMLGNKLIEKLKEIAEQFPEISQVRGRGMMIAIDINEGTTESTAKKIQLELFSHGFIIARRPGTNTLRLDPPLSIPEEVINNFINSLVMILEESS
jgi:acetylornithine/N-succinyldiaminopimelate aminotransferase